MSAYVPTEAPTIAWSTPRPPRGAARLEGRGALLLALACALVSAQRPGLALVALVVGAFTIGAMVCRPVRLHVAQLPLMRHLGPLLGSLGSVVAIVAIGLPGFTVAELIALPAMAAIGSLLIDRPLRRHFGRVRRVVLVGPDQTAVTMNEELLAHGPDCRYWLVGRISIGPADPQGHAPVLGTLDDMARIVVDHDVDLLVLSPEIPRLPVFEQLAASCLELPVRLVDLNSFCERVFGHVPVRSINAAWFQYLLHPRFRHGASPAKRAFDLVVASLVALPLLPLLCVLAPLIRRDGGPLFFVQTRIGDGGRPFKIYKLRTMRQSSGPAEWTTSDDSRVTAIGRFLRRTHIDELPQVLNVLRGDMSIVGPRPEQPGYVDALESAIPYYSRRHLIKPGITGWAQVRCGYAGSVEGSAWKLCHDLYYVKHRSFALDLVILGETVRTFFADRQFQAPATSFAVSPGAVATEGVLVAS